MLSAFSDLVSRLSTRILLGFASILSSLNFRLSYLALACLAIFCIRLAVYRPNSRAKVSGFVVRSSEYQVLSTFSDLFSRLSTRTLLGFASILSSLKFRLSYLALACLAIFRIRFAVYRPNSRATVSGFVF